MKWSEGTTQPRPNMCGASLHIDRRTFDKNIRSPCLSISRSLTWTWSVLFLLFWWNLRGLGVESSLFTAGRVCFVCWHSWTCLTFNLLDVGCWFSLLLSCLVMLCFHFDWLGLGCLFCNSNADIGAIDYVCKESIWEIKLNRLGFLIECLGSSIWWDGSRRLTVLSVG